MIPFTKLHLKLTWNYILYSFGFFVFGISQSNYLIVNYYFPYFYKPIVFCIRYITGKIPWAMGEWVYVFFCISIVINIVKCFNQLEHPIFSINYWVQIVIRFFNGLVIFYILFQLLWGLNYQKNNPAKDFSLQLTQQYTIAQMDSLSLVLIQNLNETRAHLKDDYIKRLSFGLIKELCQTQYELIAIQHPFLKYQAPSIKKAIFPSWGNFVGYTAFYQPFTGEAIVRGDVPSLTLPFTICHEIGHQLGYASETEANFIAYVVACESNNALIQYSMQLQMFSYAQHAHLQLIANQGDTLLFKKIIERNKQLLSSQVLADRKMIRDFFTSKETEQIPGSAQFYNQFLIWNKQSKGLDSYNDVLLWALSYKKSKKEFKIDSSTSYSQ